MTVKVVHVQVVDSGDVDRYGKPVLVEVETERVAHGFAPSVTAEVNGEEATIAGYGGTLYFRVPNLFTAVPGDEFVIRGDRYFVDGPGSYWEHVDGVPKGVAVIVKRAVVADG